MEYKFMAVTPEQHDTIMDLKREYKLKSQNQVLSMLLEFYEGGWTDKAKLDAILERVRNGDNDNQSRV